MLAETDALDSLATRSFVLIFLVEVVLRGLVPRAGTGFGCTFLREAPDFFAAIGFCFGKDRMQK